jgi:polyhydroxybutyrate depolymerase
MPSDTSSRIRQRSPLDATQQIRPGVPIVINRVSLLTSAFVCMLAVVLCSPALAQIDEFIDAGRGLVQVHLPPGIEDGEPRPVVIQLHGYGATADSQEDFFRLIPQADASGFILVTPEGIEDFLRQRFWNASDACCDFFRERPDDSGYLRTLIDVVTANYVVDPQRIYFAGYSNGGFMAHRMGCDHADVVAGVFSFAGATWLDPLLCDAAEPVHVAQVHGTEDGVIQYDGGCIPGLACYPSARQTADTWAAINGCELMPQLRRPARDLVQERPGRDTLIQAWPGCAAGGSAELWTIPGINHFPEFTANYAPLLAQFLLRRAKP